METAYYKTKAKILALATAFFEGDAATRAALSRNIDFFPLASPQDRETEFRSIIIRIHGDIFLVENTAGGEKGVFALLLPWM